MKYKDRVTLFLGNRLLLIAFRICVKRTNQQIRMRQLNLIRKLFEWVRLVRVKVRIRRVITQRNVRLNRTIHQLAVLNEVFVLCQVLFWQVVHEAPLF